MNNPPENIVIFPEWLTHLGFAFAVIFAIVGVIGNSITICALLKSMRTRCQATTVFIISLSVSDLIFCAFNLPMTASRYYYRAWRLGTFLCQMFPFFFYANVASSLLSIVAITINRFILVQFPHRYASIYRPRTLVCMIAAIWLISLATLVPTLGGWWGEFGLDKRTFSCTILSKNGCSPKKFLMSTGVLLPCLIVVVCYALIYRKIRASRKALLLHSGSSSRTDASGNRRHRDNARLTRTVAAIFIAFLMCFFPLMIVNVFDNDKMQFPWAHVLASILSWLSAVINPIIYSVTNQQYRSAYLQLAWIKWITSLNLLPGSSVDPTDRVQDNTSRDSRTRETHVRYNQNEDNVVVNQA